MSKTVEVTLIHPDDYFRMIDMPFHFKAVEPFQDLFLSSGDKFFLVTTRVEPEVMHSTAKSD